MTVPLRTSLTWRAHVAPTGTTDSMRAHEQSGSQSQPHSGVVQQAGSDSPVSVASTGGGSRDTGGEVAPPKPVVSSAGAGETSSVVGGDVGAPISVSTPRTPTDYGISVQST